MANAFTPAGVIPAALLPFKDDFAIDEAGYRSHLQDLAAVDGIAAITTNAHASEVHACSPEEQERILAITMEDPGPVFYHQRRAGTFRGHKVVDGVDTPEFDVFHMAKFRTMRVTGLEKQTVQATRDDPRVTRVGWVLRRFSLDELPQIFNVLGGTMSLVGPRPHAVDHNEKYAQLIRGYFARHRVKPGLTGWAQVNGFRGETRTLDAMEDRVKYDILYVENWSLLFDLKILIMTLVVCLTGRNAY